MFDKSGGIKIFWNITKLNQEDTENIGGFITIKLIKLKSNLKIKVNPSERYKPVLVIKTVWYCNKDREGNLWNKTENPKTPLLHNNIAGGMD